MMLKIGVIGFGYWGPNLVRNFNSVENATVVKICDRSGAAQEKAKRIYPHIDVVSDPDEVILSTSVDAVAIVTPVSTHFNMAEKALKNKKHVFVEKPFTETAAQGQDLIELADKNNLTLMVDHTFLFTSSIRKIKQLINDDVLGDIYYFDSMRVNLGLFQHDVNVIWDLAPHDLSIMDYLVEKKPVGISANGKSHFGSGLHDVAYITAYFQDNMIAHFNVNWLSPVKVRTTLIGGEKKMLAWNDLEADEKIKIYDKGVAIKNGDGRHRLLVSYRSGDMWVPKLENTEALKVETQYFVNCIRNNIVPMNDGYAGLRVVKMLEACSTSMKCRGEIVNV